MSATDLREKTFTKLYLDAAKVEGKPGIYFIGPFGRRVSFASQQRRALNTIWALEKAGKIREGQDIAVVGGGLAGLTAAVALAARKYSVWLYESRPRVLNAQALTMHRYVHPTVNFWPEKNLDATTQFPFMDWYADVCAPVVKGIRDEWEEFFQDRLSEIYTSTKVEKVTISDGPDDQPSVKITACGDGPEEMIFNAVVFATGFGTETVVDGVDTHSYWDEDYLPENSKSKPIMISGTGDGGLIDALRCVHKEFRLGQLAVTFAAMLDSTSMKTKLRETEDKVQEFSGKLDDEKAAAKYAELYPELLQKMDTGCRNFLNASLIKRDPPLRLVGRLSSPYSMNAAPVHKLIISHAIDAGAIIYEQGTLMNGPKFKPEVGAEQALADTLCIARHGSAHPLSAILEDAEIDQLRNNQRLLADLLEDMPYTDDYWANWDNYPARNVASSEFARFRMPLAASHVMNNFRLRLALGLQNQMPAYVIGVDSTGLSPSGNLPTSLFGVPTVTRPAEVIDIYAK
jgi:Pyridine nucleotide-disulphide oxidoreductase